MRKVVLYTLMSLDGEVDDPSRYFTDHELHNQPPEFDPDMDENEARITSTQDTVLLGRNMYDEWSGFWPTVREEAFLPFANFINNVKKYVVTSSPLTTTWHNAEAVNRPIEDVVRDLKARPGADIGVHGSITLAQSLLAANLVDELQLVVGPAAGFRGRRLFADVDQASMLELVSATPTPSGTVLLAYRVGPDRSVDG
jgi:dihydrofolate reductase